MLLIKFWIFDQFVNKWHCYEYIIFITGKTVVQKDGAIFNTETLTDSYKIYITADDDTDTTTSYLIVNILRQTRIPMSKFL